MTAVRASVSDFQGEAEQRVRLEAMGGEYVEGAGVDPRKKTTGYTKLYAHAKELKVGGLYELGNLGRDAGVPRLVAAVIEHLKKAERLS